MRTLTRALIPCLLALLAAGCTTLPSYDMDAPSSFKRYERHEGIKMMSADGVMLKVRHVDNYPRGDLAFWVDAMGRHLEAKGYARASSKPVSARNGLKGHTLAFLLPRGIEDWVLSETIFVVGDHILLVEVAGPYERYAPLESELEAALATFDASGG